MASTDLAVIETGKFAPLTKTTAEVADILRDSLGDDPLTERDLPRLEILHAGSPPKWQVPTLTGGDLEPEITGILVMYRRTRAYWEDRNPSGQPPDCRSHNARQGYGKPGGDCRSCPLSKYGSHPEDASNAQACNESELWFILREGSFLPAVIKMPPSSLNEAKKYRLALGNAGMRLTSVLTTIGLKAESNGGNKYGTAAPRVAGVLTPEEAAAAATYADELRPQLEAAADAMAEEAAPDQAQRSPSDLQRAKAAAGQEA